MDVRMKWVRGHVEVYDRTGRFLFSADSESEALRELEEAAHCIKLLGARLEECRDYTIPGTDVIHRLVVLRKVAPTLKGYPRRWAKIQKAPL